MVKSVWKPDQAVYETLQGLCCDVKSGNEPIDIFPNDENMQIGRLQQTY